MRPLGWLALAAYGMTLGAGVALAVRPGGGPAVAVIAPIGGYVTAPAPPEWAFIRLTPRPGGTTPSWSGVARALGGAVVFLLGGYAPTVEGAVRAALPGFTAPSVHGGGAAGPPGALGE